MDNTTSPSCPICLKDLVTRQPKLMPCLHTVCKACILVNPETVSSRCPVCSQECRNSSDIIDDYFILSAAAKSDTPKETLCTSCEDHAEATSYCQDCQEWLCDACVQAHYRVRVTKDHIISRKTEAERALARVGDRPLFCPNHKQEQLQLYCETCDKLTCRDCQLVYHKEHRYQFVSEASARHKSSLKVLLNKLSGKQVSIMQTKESINQKTCEVTKKQEVLIRNIQNLTSKVVLEINESARRSIVEVTSHCEKKRTILSTQMQEAVKLEKILRHCHQFTSLAVQSSSNIALLQTKKQIIKQLVLVLRTCCTRQPVTGLDINYIFNLNNHSLAQLRNFGTLIVKDSPSVHENMSAATGPNPHLKPQPQFNVHQVADRNNQNNRNVYPMQAVAPNIHMHRPSISAGVTVSQAAVNIHMPHSSHNMRFTSNHGNMMINHSNSHLHRERLETCYKTKEKLKALAAMQQAQQQMPSKVKSPPQPVSNSFSMIANNRSSTPLLQPKKEPVSPGERPSSCPFSTQKSLSYRETKSSDDGTMYAPIRIENVVSLQSEDTFKVKEEKTEEFTSSCAFAKKGVEEQQSTSTTVPVTNQSNVQGPSFTFTANIGSMVATKPSYFGIDGADLRDWPSYKDSSDPNEDWCAVCKNGGDLLCCDSCPRVYHLKCHIPILPNTPSEAFICTLCREVKDEEVIEGGQKRKLSSIFSERDQQVCERILLELFCHPSSYPFHEPVDRSVPNYYKVITKPMELISIKLKLKADSEDPYDCLEEFIHDVKQMVSNCLLFNGETSDIGRVARNIERFFLKQLKKFFPEYTDDQSNNYQEDRINKRKRRPQHIVHIK